MNAIIWSGGEMKQEELKALAERWSQRYRKGQKAWSVAHHTATFGSILCSVAAGVVLQISGQSLSGWQQR